MTKMQYAQPNRGLLPTLPEETMGSQYMRVKCDPVWRCGTNNFERDGSVLDWRKALPIGNGDIGATIHGYPDNYTFHIAKNDVWWDNVMGLDPYPALTLPELRERVCAGDAGVKHEIRRATNEHFLAQPTGTGCARLTLHVCRAGTFYNVKEYLNMMNATASTEFSVSQNGVNGGAFWMQSFVSRLEEVLVVRVRPPQGTLGEVNFTLERDPMEIGDKLPPGMDAEAFYATFRPTAVIDGNLGGFTMPLSGGDAYTVMAACDSPHVTLTSDGKSVRWSGRPDGNLTIYLTVVSSHDAGDMVAEATRRLKHALSVGFDIINSEHGSWWNRFWWRSWIALPKGYSERSWYWGLYKAGSARRPGKVCPAYAAPWYPSNHVNWGCFTLNYEEVKYNLGMLATNHAELLEPWIAVVRRAAARLKRTTERFYGLPGVCFPHAITWMGEPAVSASVYNSTALSVNTTGEAVKCAWDYYDFTGDLDFLRTVGYPLLKEAALFYHAYLIEEEDGRLTIFPSRYNENDSWCEGLDDFMRNSVTDLTMFRLVLRRAAQAAEILQVDADLAADWRDAFTRLAPYATWADGSWKPSEDWLERGVKPFAPHPNLFETWPITVGDELDACSGPAELMAAARATYQRWLGHHPLQTWDRCFPYLTAMRMGDREYAEKILQHLHTIPEAGNIDRSDQPEFGEQDGLSPFAVDAGSAFPAEIITEMLLQSHTGVIRLFPAAPTTGHFAFHSLRARGAFLVSSEFRDGQTPYVLVQSLHGAPCRIANPFGEAAGQVRDLDTGALIPAQRDADDIFTFSTEQEHMYVLERIDCPLDQVPLMQTV